MAEIKEKMEERDTQIMENVDMNTTDTRMHS